MDLIGIAKKIGLVYEKDSRGEGNFSFITDAMRKILLEAAGKENQKHLYSRLGNIKAELYAGNLDAVAGELYYNFKKAEENERAEQYGKIAREGRGSFYGQSFEYAQSLLKEAREEKAVVLLSKSALARMPEIIRHIYIAVMNYNLYPPQNQMRTSFIKELHQRLLAVLQEVEILIIALVGTDIVINNNKAGKELTNFFADAFINFLKSINAHSVSFLRGIREEDLSVFVELASAPDKLEEPLPFLLNSAGVGAIQINEIIYDVARKKPREKENLEEIMLADYLLGKFSGYTVEGGANVLGVKTTTARAEEIMRILEKAGEEASAKTGHGKEEIEAEIIAKSIERIGRELHDQEGPERARYKENLAKAILSMEPNLRAKLLSSWPQEPEGAEVIKEIAAAVSDETIVDVLVKQYQQYEKNNINFKDMQKLLKRFLPNPGRKPELYAKLKDKFMHLDVSQEECAWMFGERAFEDLSLDDKVNYILALSDRDLKIILPLVDLTSLMMGLLARDKEEAAIRIKERIFDVLSAGDLSSDGLVEALESILKAATFKANEGFLKAFICSLLDLLRNKNFYPCFFRIINPCLNVVMEIFLRGESFEVIKKVAAAYADSPDRLADSVRILDLACGRLAQDLIRRIEAELDWSALSEILILLKDYSVRHLIEKILFEEGVQEGKYFEAYLRRRTIGKILNRMPIEVVSLHLKEKILSARHGREYIVKNIVEAIGSIENEEVVGVLEPLIKYPNIALRGKIILNLSKRQGERSAFLLGEALSDENEGIRNNAREYLKNRKDDFALAVLKKKEG